MNKRKDCLSEQGLSLLDEWRKFVCDFKRYSSNTVRSYSRDIRFFLVFVEFHLGNKISLQSLKNLKPIDFRSWLADERKFGTSPESLARYVSSVREFYNWLNDKKSLANFSVFSIQLPRKKKKLPRPISEVNVMKLLSLTSENRSMHVSEVIDRLCNVINGQDIDYQTLKKAKKPSQISKTII